MIATLTQVANGCSRSTTPVSSLRTAAASSIGWGSSRTVFSSTGSSTPASSGSRVPATAGVITRKVAGSGAARAGAGLLRRRRTSTAREASTTRAAAIHTALERVNAGPLGARRGVDRGCLGSRRLSGGRPQRVDDAAGGDHQPGDGQDEEQRALAAVDVRGQGRAEHRHDEGSDSGGEGTAAASGHGAERYSAPQQEVGGRAIGPRPRLFGGVP